MTLRQYLGERGITYEVFAAIIGVDTSTVGRYVVGRRRPREEIMRRIHKATDGAVTANDFYLSSGEGEAA